MEVIGSKNGDFVINLESCWNNSTSGDIQSIKVEDKAALCSSVLDSSVVSVENVKVVIDKILEGEAGFGEKKLAKEKRKSKSNKMSPKPPRPPRGPSLDAADMKLIRELTELAVLKRARMERIKASKKMKAAKASSSSSNLFAMVLTVIFCLVILYQGISSGSSSPASLHQSPGVLAGTEGSFVSVQNQAGPVNDSSKSYSGSPSLVEQISGLDPQEKSIRVAE